jgi:cation-transporting ATPase E
MPEQKKRIMSEQFSGLSAVEVNGLQRAGADNSFQKRHGRSYWDIVRTNLLSTYNIILFTIGAVLAILGRYNDAFITVIVGFFNALISIVQEIRAKRQLDAIAVIASPRVTVQREGTAVEIPPAGVVRGDLIWLRGGEQAVVDGRVVDHGVVEMDESLLTGESTLIRKQQGDEILSGSFCVSGMALYEAEKVGEESYANRLTAEAKAFEVVSTPLQAKVAFVVNLIILLAVIMAMIFYLSGFIQDFSFLTNVKATAVLVGLVPYGLFLTISAAYAIGAATIARKGALVQQINAVESLNGIDVLCMDKTGTLTSNELVLESIKWLQDEPDRSALGDFTRSISGGNKTNRAIEMGTSGQKRDVAAEVPFSSSRKWSALAFSGAERHGVYVLGAFEVLQEQLPASLQTQLNAEINLLSQQGLRVLLFAANQGVVSLFDDAGDPQLPELTPLALIAIRDSLRPQVVENIAAFQNLGVQLKIISGDNPQTVAAVAKQAGVNQSHIVSGPELAQMDEVAFALAADDHNIFGRITPEQKQQLVLALMQQGHRVAMIGDGVNDVLSLKKADLGIAMQSGSNAARNVADMVLLNDSYAALPHALRESKRVITGIIDATYLLTGRSLVYALVIIGVMMVGISFPFEPAQTGLTTFSVGIPAFCLTLWAPPKEKAEPLLRSLMRLIVPYTLWTMLLGVLLYSSTLTSISANISANQLPPGAVARLEEFTGVTYDLTTDFELVASTLFAQTELSAFLTLVAILFVLFLAPPHRFFTGWRDVSADRRPLWLVIILSALFLITLNIRAATDYFGMLPLPPRGYLNLLVATAIWLVGFRILLRQRFLDRFLIPPA